MKLQGNSVELNLKTNQKSTMLTYIILIQKVEKLEE